MTHQLASLAQSQKTLIICWKRNRLRQKCLSSPLPTSEDPVCRPQSQSYTPRHCESCYCCIPRKAQWHNREELGSYTPHQTVLQQHVEYWDTDRDVIIWSRDTYDGCRKWRWSLLLALLVTLIINLNLSHPILPGYLPDPFCHIYVHKLYKDKHGSDSMTYDNEGRFKPQGFEDIFAKYYQVDKGGLDI